MNCSQVAMFQIMPALCPLGQREKRGGQPNVDRPGQEEGVTKIPKFVRTSFMDDSVFYLGYHCIVL